MWYLEAQALDPGRALDALGRRVGIAAAKVALEPDGGERWKKKKRALVSAAHSHHLHKQIKYFDLSKRFNHALNEVKRVSWG